MISREAHFQLLCGLSVKNFNMLFGIVSSYTNAIIYLDCKGNGIRTLGKSTELLTYLTICRHSLHLGVMLDLGESTIYRIFVGLAAVLEILFTQLNLKPSEGYLLKNMPAVFVKTEHGMTDIVIDCTEIEFQHI